MQNDTSRPLVIESSFGKFCVACLQCEDKVLLSIPCRATDVGEILNDCVNGRQRLLQLSEVQLLSIRDRKVEALQLEVFLDARAGTLGCTNEDTG